MPESSEVPKHMQFRMHGFFYWCFDHEKVEERDEPVEGCRRVGPWLSSTEAEEKGSALKEVRLGSR